MKGDSMYRPQNVTIRTEDTATVSTCADTVLGAPFVVMRGTDCLYLTPLEARTLALILTASADAAESLTTH
jgi:hypothetical protein